MSRKKVLAAAGIFIIVLAVIMAAHGGSVQVKTFAVEAGPFTGYIEENGLVESIGAREIQAAVSGRVAEIRVDEGQQVKAGDVLAVLEKGDLQSEVEKSLALVQEAKSQLEGAVSGAGANELAQARAEVEQARTNLADAQRQAAQAEVLLKSGAIS